MIQFVDPRAEPGAPVEPYTLSLDDVQAPLTVGLLANGFPDSVSFLDHVEQALRTTLPQASFRRYDKGNASAVISDQMLDDVVGACHAVVAAYGH